MAVVIRLQGLPVVASSSDIRRFFSGLNIPYGGVHIIGGEKGEAFIIFATDEDARQAMSYSGGYIKDSRIEFFLSSKTEMQNIIESGRKRVDHKGRERAASKWTDSRIGISSYEDSFHSNDSRNRNDLPNSRYDHPREESFEPDNLYLLLRGMPYSATEDDVLTFFAGLQVDGVIIFKTKGLNNGLGIVKFATPNDATKGLQRNREYMGKRFIEIHRANEATWIKNGGRVEEKVDPPFSSEHFAHDLNNTSFYSSRENTRGDSDYLSRRHTHSRSPPRRVVTHTDSLSPPRRIVARTSSRSPPSIVISRHHSRSPPRRIMTHTHSRSPRRIVSHTSSRSPPMGVMARTRSRSPPRRTVAHSSSRSPLRRIRTHTQSISPPRRNMTHTRSRSPRRRIVPHTSSRSPVRRIMPRTRSRSPPRRVMTHSHSRSPPRRVTSRSHSPYSQSPHNKDYFIHVKNLPLHVEKRDLRAFFEGSDVPSSQITFLKSYENETNKDAIVMFSSMREYNCALGYHKHDLHGRQILLYPISKTAVLQLPGFSESNRSPERDHHVKEKSDWDGYSGPKTCIYVRKLPYDVTKAEVQKFFAGFNIYENGIHLLYDEKGIGLGEALVKFRSEGEARKAESLNLQHFWGTEVLLRCISEAQMQEFGVNVSSVSDEKMQNHRHTYQKGQHVYQGGSQGLSVQGKLKHPSNSRHMSGDFISSPDRFRDLAPFTEFDEDIRGHFPHGRFMPDSNFSGGTDRATLIKLKNLPFRASPNEILDFFHGYKIIPESLSFQHNKYGMSSGEAVVALVNYSEAMAAIKELNDRPIGSRKIRLSLL
ncbi:RNA-binding protein 12B-like [Sceloporus undulatus]|uniref:RNA-binding protein 12B-like n=1 Tax=Sceloporus undulatus TaxID=8520 RepID=UPI001C4BD466|nr:RNA-binding protein 12B-like [Sceloporus undulatus]XP_042317910.1 RNA-binding protein 12B-like [Sceloporus undulatus]